eukprot:TRINITY_DN103_c1_g4_i3.p1 TRINITY_DN103_c1_g4~~TRINITY_DN103_c1_g4_i3.p1  ORF type:complete len:190 (+),score=34.54 TRINITY_DN103_c1_g4_i3:175-744(+)
MNALESVTPGQSVGNTSEFSDGDGTYTHGGSILSSLVGFRQITINKEGLSTVSVTRTLNDTVIVPSIGSVVTAKVVRVNTRQAAVKILCVGTHPLKTPADGLIRSQDVRMTDIDRVEMYGCFRPGDVVRAEVISFGDKRSYFLSTAKNELGVIFAKSVAGVAMVPLSWKAMQCPKTKTNEARKVAKTVE